MSELVENFLARNQSIGDFAGYFGNGFPGDPFDVLDWLYPSVSHWSSDDQRALHDFLAKRKPHEDRWQRRAVRKFFRLLDSVAITAGVSESANSYVIVSLQSVVGPCFNRGPIECIATLRSIRTAIKSTAVSEAVSSVIARYEEVIEFGEEIENQLRKR